jgi:hypothetical protein
VEEVEDAFNLSLRAFLARARGFQLDTLVYARASFYTVFRRASLANNG